MLHYTGFFPPPTGHPSQVLSTRVRVPDPLNGHQVAVSVGANFSGRRPLTARPLIPLRARLYLVAAARTCHFQSFLVEALLRFAEKPEKKESRLVARESNFFVRFHALPPEGPPRTRSYGFFRKFWRAVPPTLLPSSLSTCQSAI